MKKLAITLGMTALALILTGSVLLSSAQAWWNEEWQFRKKISLDTTASGADIQQGLAGFSVLVRLHSGNFDFTKTKESGEDIRFVAADELTVLKHQIEVYDPFDEIGLIWVKVPDLAGASNQGAVWLYYGNESAAGGQDIKNSFDPMTQAVFHFNEFEGMPQDSSTYSNHSSEFTGGLGLAGSVGNGATFSGSGNMLRIPDNPAFNWAPGMTFSCWIKMFQPQDDAYLLSRMSGGKGLAIAVRGTKITVMIASGDSVYQTEEITDIPLEGWHHLAVTIVPNGRITVYLDGTETQWSDAKADLSGITGDLLIGSDIQGAHSFAGDLDEVRISGAARPQDWIRAAVASQGPEAKLCFYGMEEISEGGGGMPVFYLATIFKNITLDGLVVIGLLLVLSGLSWIIMISKGIFLFSMGRGNKNFLNEYYQAADPIALGAGATSFSGSGMYRIYEAGCNSISFPDVFTGADEETQPTRPTLSKKAIENLKGVLEKGLVDEAKKLNSWLVILTMSISGGPFLGLLGTVWGVMNTFAAMAEAGEANIMAIAPGVASALSTTVFGLIVAIPALFGYNFLAGRIRDISADNGIFVDQFALKVDETYGEPS